MMFDEYWAEIERLNVLPGMAIQQLPSSLSANTKKLLKKRPEETAELLNIAIDEVNHGSVESIDSWVRRRLRLRSGIMISLLLHLRCPSH